MKFSEVLKLQGYNLEELTIVDKVVIENKTITDFDIPLWEGLENLVFENCNFTHLPKLPKSLKALWCRDCNDLISINDFPSNVRSICLLKCSNLKEIPKLPQRLLRLNLKDCISLEKLPDSIGLVESLDITNCAKISSLPDLKKLVYFCCTGCTGLPHLNNGNLILFDIGGDEFSMGFHHLTDFSTGYIKFDSKSKLLDYCKKNNPNSLSDKVVKFLTNAN